MQLQFVSCGWHASQIMPNCLQSLIDEQISTTCLWRPCMLILWPNLPMQSRSSLKSVSNSNQFISGLVVNVLCYLSSWKQSWKIFPRKLVQLHWNVGNGSPKVCNDHNTTNHIERYVKALKFCLWLNSHCIYSLAVPPQGGGGGKGGKFPPESN